MVGEGWDGMGVPGWGLQGGVQAISLGAGERGEEADGQHRGHAEQRGDQLPAQGKAGGGPGHVLHIAARRAPPASSEARLLGSAQPPQSPWPPCRGSGCTSRECALQFRAESVVPARMAEMTRCVQERDFQAFGQLTMKDSNQFHATCLDTFPPISYLSDTSRRIVQLVHRFNAHHGQTKARRGGRWGLTPLCRLPRLAACSLGQPWGPELPEGPAAVQHKPAETGLLGSRCPLLSAGALFFGRRGGAWPAREAAGPELVGRGAAAPGQVAWARLGRGQPRVSV